MNKLLEISQHIFTARDGVSYSLTKLAGICGLAALTYNFIKLGSTDYSGYGLAVTGIMAAFAVKYAVEEK